MITDLLQSDDLQRLRNLQVLVRNRVEGFCSGLHRSPNKGHSVEFREHRPYSKGDELRGIDWKVFGKTDRLFIRQYEEETNLRCHLLIDTSGSMAYGDQGPSGSKLRYASRLAAAVAYLMIHQQDSVGLVSFDDQIRSYLSPRSRVTHLGVIADQLIGLNPKIAEPTQLPSPEKRSFDLQSLVPKLRRGGLVIVFSDCFGDLESLKRSLSQFMNARNDVVVFQTLDADEIDFPFKKVTQFRSLEYAKIAKRMDAARIRDAYLQRFEAYQQELSVLLSGIGVPLVTTTSNTPIGDTLAGFMRRGGEFK